jgi:hypothetical protein
MNSLRRLVTSAIAVAVVISLPLGYAQVPGLQEKLETQYTITKATADRSDIVTAGAVLVLQKDGLLMYTTTTTVPPTNTYKDGKISQGFFGFTACKWCKKIPGNSSPNVDNRTFVTGEKFWVTKIYMHDDGLFFELFSDPISDVRYYSLLKFPFPKGSTPSADQMVSAVAEVFKVQPADDSGGDTKAAAPAAKSGAAAASSSPASSSSASAAPPAAMAPIAPPPPPVDAPPAQPKTVAKGQTKDQVIAIFGQPTKIANLGTKEIDYYPDFKVTFIGGKVADVQ